MKKIIIPCFIALAIIQWAVPASMIMGREKVLAEGKDFRFLTAPVDPAHPFKGRYIFLSFKENSYSVPSSRRFSNGQKIYVRLAEDSKGFAIIDGITEKREERSDYVEASIDYIQYNGDTTVVNISYPFEQFYMNEYKAPEAEAVYRDAQRDTSKLTYALVSVLNGEAVVKNVFIDDQPIGQIGRGQK